MVMKININYLILYILCINDIKLSIIRNKNLKVNNLYTKGNLF